MGIKQRGKRLLDLALTVPLLCLIWPLLVLGALLVGLGMGRPILFRQQRPGLGGRAFTVLKFRTMTEERDACGQLKGDQERLTRTGNLLRRTSIDELPQLWNVLRGEMSLVGPRPLLMEYLKNYSAEQMRRHEVLPGITGWAQIHGRNELPFSERLRLDLWYVEHWSLWLDLRILARTVVKVIRSHGVELRKFEEVDDLGLHCQSKKEEEA